MTTIVIPDQVIAYRALLRGAASGVHPLAAQYVTELRAYYITSDGWIDTFIPDPSQLPRNAVRISAAGGPDSDTPGYAIRRVQFDCYGATEKDAAAIAWLVSHAIRPLARDRANGFTAAGTRIAGALNITGPLPGVDPDVQPRAPYRTVTVDVQMLDVGVA